MEGETIDLVVLPKISPESITLTHEGVPHCATSTEYPEFEGRGWSPSEAVEDLQAQVLAITSILPLPPPASRLFPEGQNRSTPVKLFRCDLRGPDQFQHVQAATKLRVFYAHTELPDGNIIECCAGSYREAILDLVRIVNKRGRLVPQYEGIRKAA